MLTDPSVPERDRRYGRLMLAAWRLADARDAAEAHLRLLAEHVAELG